MTRQEFLDLQQELTSTGKMIKVFLREKGIKYSTYAYWRRRVESEKSPMPIAPITIREQTHGCQSSETEFNGVDIPGVTLAFPNGLRAHFGRGSESVLMKLFDRSLENHVLPQ